MSLKRTPPPVIPPPISPRNSTLQHSDSEPNLNTTMDSEAYHTALRKRKYSNKMSDDFSYMEEKFTALFKDLKREQDSQLSTIIAWVGDIRQQNNDIRESINFMSEKYDALLSDVRSLREENKGQQSRIKFLEEKLEGIERSAYTSRIELRNVPKTDRETKEDLVNILVRTGEVLGSSVTKSDVKDIFCINIKNDSTNKPIIADFTSCITKENFIRNSRKYNKANLSNKLNSADIGIAGPRTPVFISENLPLKSRQLYAVARNYAKVNNYAYCWTSAGRVYLRRTDRDKPILVKTQEDINRLPTA